MIIHCAYDSEELVNELKENPKNPNFHSEKQIELLAKIIKTQGWRTPITVSNRSNYIVRGHGRLRAAKLLGLDKVPVDYQDYESEEQEIADMIADNKIQEFSSLDDEIVSELLSEFGEDFDIELTGFNIEDLDFSLIDDLEDNNFSNLLKEESTTFAVSFLFKKEHEELVKKYINEHGKEGLSDKLIEFIKEGEVDA